MAPALPRYLAYAAPSALTLAALACSLTAMRVAVSQRFELASGLIIAAAFCDALDGHLARLLDAATVFGGELDSLGDLVNFGVAPAIVMHAWADEATGDSLDVCLWVSCVILCQACALRLARFNSGPGGPAHQGEQSSETQPEQPLEGKSKGSVVQPTTRRFVAKAKFFSGVPAPMGALLALLPLFWQLETGRPLFGRPRREVVCVVNLLVACLMISSLKTLSSKMFVRDPKKASHLTISSPWEGMLKVSGVLGAVATSMMFSPWLLVLTLEFGYVASLFVGPVIYAFFAE
ncbi:unnamed protein product [Polarella glacialis]|uniref:CDP-diacylglycerol--serine O-phosphatidyltransferase n=1 Tax=Polarella glacialis TaxID=89957 RepID=A0A813IK02_POLGL|nr:unnamed protein product [Polarella glacialis]